MTIFQNKFELNHKFGMINLWRKRCDELTKVPGATKVDSDACKICNDLTKEIEEELRELDRLREEEKMKPPNESSN